MLLFHAPPESARGIEVTSGLEQRLESEGGIRIAAPARALQRRAGTDDILARREEDADTERRGRMVGRISEFVRTFRAVQVTTTLEHAAKVERAVRVSALPCALIAGHRLVQISALFEEDPQVDRGGGMAERVRLPICAFRGGQIATGLEEHTETEPLLSGTNVLHRCICAPGHPQNPVNVRLVVRRS